MGREREIELLNEIGKILTDLNGFTDNDFLFAGVTPHCLLNPTEETLEKMREYSLLQQKKDEVNTISM